MKYTHKAPFDKGYNGMVSAVENPEMMGMEFGVVKMAAGDVMHFDYAQEVVYDLMSGTVTFEWNGQSETVTRRDVFHEGEHKKVFAYEAYTACDKHNFILGVHVTPGNIHDSVAFDSLYDDICQHYPEHKPLQPTAPTKPLGSAKESLKVAEF